jgi:Rps23 Pro-64 3,4-dihydroxylase Tpa1-like proline 4-hydroxylase
MSNPTQSLNEPIPLFEINPDLDRAALAQQFARERRIQVRDVLTERTAKEILRILAEETPWGISWQAGAGGQAQHLRPQQLASMTQQQRAGMSEALGQAISGSEYAFIYAAYPMVDSVLERWAPDNPLDLLLEHINDEPFLSLVREITGVPELIKADAQATLYRAGHFLSQHSDSHKDEGWRIAYVLNLTSGEWRPDWGGFLLFHDEEGNVISGYRPRFNSLNMFAVPQWHSVSYVAPFAPVARYAITGWARDR